MTAMMPFGGELRLPLGTRPPAYRLQPPASVVPTPLGDRSRQRAQSLAPQRPLLDVSTQMGTTVAKKRGEARLAGAKAKTSGLV